LASEAFTKAVAIDPEYADAWNNLAACHLFLRNAKAAFNAFEQVKLEK
jgi:Tfp pilus assembly protein PilF